MSFMTLGDLRQSFSVSSAIQALQGSGGDVTVVKIG